MMNIKSRLSAARLAAASALVVAAIAPASAQTSNIVTTWSASPSWGQPSLTVPTLGFDKDTIRTVVQSSVGGDLAQIRISNLYGSKPLTVGRATIALSTTGSSIRTKSIRDVTFNGRSSIVIQPGGLALSDQIDFEVSARTDLAVSLYLTDAQGPATSHDAGSQTSYVISGDKTYAATLDGAATTASRYFLAGVDVRSKQARGTIVTFGDSITDGVGSTTDADRRWPDQLARRLQEAGLNYGVANAGIGGNGHVVEWLPQAGENASTRFDRDVLALPNVTHLIILLGINDIGVPGFLLQPPTPAARIIESLAQLTARAKAHGIKVHVGTLLPFAGATFPRYYSAAGEQVREEVNAYIRQAKTFGVIDFEAVMRSPGDPDRIRPAYDSGDGLHPNDKGYKAMAEAINLSIFR